MKNLLDIPTALNGTHKERIFIIIPNIIIFKLFENPTEEDRKKTLDQVKKKIHPIKIMKFARMGIETYSTERERTRNCRRDDENLRPLGQKGNNQIRLQERRCRSSRNGQAEILWTLSLEERWKRVIECQYESIINNLGSRIVGWENHRSLEEVDLRAIY